MNNRMQAIRVGLFFLLGLALLWSRRSRSPAAAFSKKRLLARRPFRQPQGTPERDDVLMPVCELVGRPSPLVDRQAEAVLTIDSLSQIATDAVAMVAQSSLLGTNHLEVTVGSPTAAKLPPVPKSGPGIRPT